MVSLITIYPEFEPVSDPNEAEAIATIPDKQEETAEPSVSHACEGSTSAIYCELGSISQLC